MPHRPHHNRIRSPWVGNGQSCTSSRAGHPQAANLFEAPPLDVETTARENALWVEVRGEADLGNHEQLLAGLTRVKLDGADAVHLVLTELTFCDLCAYRHIISFATRVRAAGRELSAHGASPTIKKIAGLLNVAGVLHFV